MTAADNYHVYFDEAGQYVIMKWTGYSTSAAFREGTQLMLDTLKENKASKVLADVRDMDLIGMDDQHWLEHVFLPAAMREGFKTLAIVSPRSYFNKVAIDNISEKIDREKLDINIFNNLDEARNWLANDQYGL
jgi:hypothetical protein